MDGHCPRYFCGCYGFPLDEQRHVLWMGFFVHSRRLPRVTILWAITMVLSGRMIQHLLVPVLLVTAIRRKPGAYFEAYLMPSSHFQDARLPKPFCGFERQGAYGPTHYPVACLPQSWASGAPFLFLRALLGLQPDARHRRLVVHTPSLPGGINRIEFRHLQLGQNKLSLKFERLADGTNVSLMEGTDIDIQVVPV